MISLSAALHLLLYLVVVGVIWWLLNWLLDYCGVPEPFHKVGKVLLAVLAVVLVIGVLLSLLGGGVPVVVG